MIEYLAGAAVALVFCLVGMGRMVTVWYDKHIEAQATIVELRETIKNLEARKSPTFQVRDGATESVVVRNRPDLPPPRESTVSHDAGVVDLTSAFLDE